MKIAVLYVDDEKELHLVAKRSLERSGEFIITAVSSAEEALHSLHIGSFDAVISDYQMPGMDGITLLKEIRKRQGDLPFILFTGRGREEVAIEALNNGADFYLQKGGDQVVQFAELANHIRCTVSRRRAEQEVLKSKKQVSDIIDFLPDATLAVNSEGVIIAWNKAMKTLTGCSSEEMVGRTIQEFTQKFNRSSRPSLIELIDEPDEVISRYYSNVSREDNSTTVESVFTRSDGVVFTVQAKISRLFNPDGEVAGAIESLRDITDLKKTGENLQRSEARYRSIVDDMTEMIIRFTPDGKVTFVNEASRQYFTPMLPFPEIEGKNIHDLMQAASYESGENFLPSLTLENPIWTHELCITDEEGRVRWQSWSVRALFDQEKRLVEYQIVGHDITDRKLAEEATREKEEKLRLLSDNLPDGMVYQIIIEPDGNRHFTYISAGLERYHGISVNDVMRDPMILYNQYLDEDRAELLDAEDKSIRGRTIFTIQARYRTPDGAIRWSLLKSIPRVLPDGKIVWDGFEIDITDQKNAEDELKKKNYELLIAYEEITVSEEELRKNINKLIQKEEFIRVSEERLILAQEISHTGCWEYDLRSDTIAWSDELYRVFGYEPGRVELTLDLIRSAFHPDDVELHDRILNAAIETHDYEPAEYRVIYPDGSLHYIIANGRIDVDETGKAIRIIGVCQDITDRKILATERERLITELKTSNEALVAANEDIAGAEEELRHQYDALNETEKSLHETKDFLESLISIANVPIIIWDSSFRITRLNQAFEHLIGQPADHLIGNSLEILFPPNQADRSLRLLRTTLDGVRWETTEIDIMHQNGSILTLLWNSATLYAPDGLTPVATIAQGHDVTSERRLEQEKEVALAQIQENLAYLAILNDEIRNPLTTIITVADMVDDQQVITLITDQVTRIDDMVNQLDTRWVESEKVLNAIRKHYQVHTGTRTPLMTEMPALKILQGPNLSPQNEKILIEEVQAQLYSILDSIDSLIYVADMESYETIFINRRGRALFGDIIGQKCYKAIHNLKEPCPFCTNHLLTDDSGPVGMYQWESESIQSARWYDCRDRAIRWSDGRIVRLEIATDITERKRTEESLHEANQKLRLLTGLTRHDIFNKLFVLQGIFELAMEESDLALIHQYLIKAIQTSQSIDKTIKFTREYENFGIESSGWQNVHQVIESSREEIIPGNVVVENMIPNHLEIYADPIIRKVFSTLIENALRHGGHLTRIWFSYFVSYASLVITCEDDGCGIPTEEKQQIFDHGYGKHTGIGLFLATEILSITGISMRETGTEGHGARFEIIIPVGKFRGLNHV